MNEDKAHLLFFDKDQLLQQQDEEFAAIMIDTFWNDEPYEDLIQLQKLLEDNDIEQATLLLHKVKPNFSIIGMYNFYQELERIYRDLYERKSVESRLVELKKSLNLFFEAKNELQNSMTF